MDKKWSFPLLKTDELVACLFEMGIEVSPGDLVKPKVEVIHHVFASLVEKTLQIAPEELAAPMFHAIEHVSHTELHNSSIPTINLLRKCNELFRICQLPLFPLHQFMKPTREWVARTISGICNFAKFRESELVKHHKCTEETERLTEILERTREKLDEVESSIAAEERKREEERPEREALTRDCEELEGIIAARNKEQALLRCDTTEIKETLNEVKAATTTIANELVDAKQTLSKVQRQIVQSPDRLKAELSAMAEKLESEKAGLESVEKERRGLHGKLERVAKAEKTMTKLIGVLEDATNSSRRYKDELRSVKGGKTTLQQQRRKRAQLDTDRQHLERTLARVTENLKNLRDTGSKEVAVAIAAHQMASTKLDAKRKEIRKLNRVEANGNKEKMAIDAKLEEARAQYAAMNKSMHEEYDKLVTDVRSYHAKLLPPSLIA